MNRYMKHTLVLALAVIAAACTVTDTVTPPLAGPSELSLSLAINANPDVLSQDGGSQSVITVDARDPNGQPVPNQLLRVEIQGGDFGSLSARTVVTNSSGRASFTYTAPPGPSGSQANVFILVTPAGSDNANAQSRAVNIRLNPEGTIPTGAPTPRFTFLPADPAANQVVRFDGSASTPALGTTITGYLWDFGDGRTSTGVVATHSYADPGAYAAKLTVTDSQGISATSASQIVEVGDGAVPSASFVFSPQEPTAGTPVFFNAATTVPGSGHRIVSYRWNWGDGSAQQTGITRSHTYGTAGNYVVTLTVTDEAGQTATTSQTVPVG